MSDMPPRKVMGVRELLDLLERDPKLKDAVRAYWIWITAPKEPSYARLAKWGGHSPQGDRRNLHTEGKRLVEKLVNLGFPTREEFRAVSWKKRWAPGSHELWDELRRKYHELIEELDAQSFEALLDVIRARGYEIRKRQ